MINVGANSKHRSKARSPIFPDGTWIYVPFPTDHADLQRQAFPDETLPYVRNGSRCHLDPDWDGLTYGDLCMQPRAISLLKVKKDDILLFWALLWETDKGGCIFESAKKGWYVIGAMRAACILKAGEQIVALPTDVRQRVSRNAHISGGRVKEREGERVFVASANNRHSRRFSLAIDWEIGRDGGLMQRVVRTSKGQQISWNIWPSVTRSCRAILDLENPRDRDSAGLLSKRISEKNEGFELIDGL
jgi:hypothetical protein